MMLNRGKITLILVGWLLSTISYGGSYTVDYSGGHATISNAPSTPNYTNVGTFGTEPGWGGSWAQSASPCQISCQGAVTATFTFHPAYPGELPPAAVLIKKNVSITWSGSGAFNTGQTPQTSSPNGVLSTKFEVRNNPATTFTATFSPSGSTVNSMGEEFAQPATASVNCTATCYNIDLELSGIVKQNESNFALIGKRITAGFAFSGSNLMLPEMSFGGQNWSASGDLFDSFQVIGGIHASHGHRINVAPSEWTKPSPKWVWNSGSNEIVTGSANILLESVVIGSVSSAKLVTVEEPASTFVADAAGLDSWSYWLRGEVSSDGNPAVVMPGGQTVGILFTGNAHKPAKYIEKYGKGAFAWAQLCDMDFYVDTTPTSTGGYVLDNQFPYDLGGDDVINNAPSNDVTYDSDTPALSWRSYYLADDTFKMYMIYQASASDWEYVPLRMQFWDWTCRGSDLGKMVPSYGTRTITNTLTTAHPEWDSVFMNVE